MGEAFFHMVEYQQKKWFSLILSVIKLSVQNLKVHQRASNPYIDYKIMANLTNVNLPKCQKW